MKTKAGFGYRPIHDLPNTSLKRSEEVETKSNLNNADSHTNQIQFLIKVNYSLFSFRSWFPVFNFGLYYYFVVACHRIAILK